MSSSTCCEGSGTEFPLVIAGTRLIAFPTSVCDLAFVLGLDDFLGEFPVGTDQVAAYQVYAFAKSATILDDP